MADAQPQQPQQINLPSLALILVLSGLIVRYLFFSPPSSSSSGSSSASSSLRAGADPAAVMRAREAAVERIQQMFPQAERRAVLWDLQRGGGSVAGTAERILAGRLETVSLFLCLVLVARCG
jgi:coupling of ubiquitin conjugation to ER degradation protein 1